MINPFEVNATGVYMLNGHYSHHGFQGCTQGEITLYPDNRVIGSVTDNEPKAVLKRIVLGLYDSYKNAIELIKVKDGGWAPIFWRFSGNKAFSRRFEGEYEGRWINSVFIEDTSKFNSYLEELCKIGIDKLGEIDVEALKHFFNLHVTKEFDGAGRIAIQRQNNL